MWIVYLLKCRKKSFYCGITNNLERRIKQHNSELAGGAKYTRANQPCVLVYQENALDRSAAAKRECAIKNMSHANKHLLIQKQ